MFKTDDFLQLTKSEWAKHLTDFEDATLDSAFQQCLENVYPPTLPRFISYCKLIQKKEEEYFSRHGEVDVASHEVAEAHLQKIRRLLNMPPKLKGETACYN